jgi:hypothetical protein
MAILIQRAQTTGLIAKRPMIEFWCAAGLLAGAAFLAYDAIPDLPIGIQVDEPKKARFVLDGDQDFFHPLLMLQLVRLANRIAGLSDVTAVVGLGRTVAAVLGGLMVFATIVLARRVVGPWLALSAGMLAAVTPLTVLHAQLFKEDVFVAPWLLLGLAALDWLREDTSVRRAVALGILAGLAAATKYVGIILIPIALALPLFAPMPASSLRRFYAALALSIGIGLAVFSLVNAPLFMTPRVFTAGLGNQIDQVLISGHNNVVLYGWYTWFLFEWTTSLCPGLGPTLALGGILGALLVVAAFRTTAPAVRIALVFGMVWYLMHELSPMKQFVADVRHMTVMAGIFAVLAVFLIDFVCKRAPSTWRPVLAAASVFFLAAPAAWSSIIIVESSPNDTRVVIDRVRAALDGPHGVDWQATLPSDIPHLVWNPKEEIERIGAALDGPHGIDWGATPLIGNRMDEIEQSMDFVIMVESIAQRYIIAHSFSHQPAVLHDIANRYVAMLNLPAIVVTSTAGTFSYRNLSLRVVALHGSSDRLAAIIAKVGPLPQTDLRLVPGDQARSP